MNNFVITSLSLHQVILREYEKDPFGKCIYPARSFNTINSETSLSDKGTYCISFGRYNGEELKYFLEKVDVNILLVSDKSLNGHSGHSLKDGPVLTLVVFEVDYNGPIRVKNEQGIEV